MQFQFHILAGFLLFSPTVQESSVTTLVRRVGIKTTLILCRNPDTEWQLAEIPRCKLS